MQLIEIGGLVHARREQVGLSQQRLAVLTGLSRATINQLERGTLKDLGIAKLISLAGLLGIDISANAKPPKANGLLMAAVTSSVSYRNQLDRHSLAKALATGIIPPGYHAQIGTLLGEAPLGLLVKAVEESAQREGVTPKKIWGHVYQWVKELQITRPALNE
jgi:transcriptional regulator with XRE-family HTH domain